LRRLSAVAAGWIVPALAIFALAAVDLALRDAGHQHLVTLASFFASDW
jgi:hypothetical protein